MFLERIPVSSANSVVNVVLCGHAGLRNRRGALLVLLVLLALPAMRQSPRRVNPMIDLLEQGKPVFGIYAPRNARNAETQKTPAQLAVDALEYAGADVVFDGSMEGNFERAFAVFEQFVRGMAEAGPLESESPPRLAMMLTGA